MKVQSCMTPDVRCIKAEESLLQAAKIMWEVDCGALPVLNNELQVIGMVTDRDIAMAGFIQGRPLRDILVSEAMSKCLVSIGINDELSVAEELMQSKQLRRLPVLDGKQQQVGILSLNDIARAYKADSGKAIKANEVADTLASVCTHRTLAKVSSIA
ncbi:CBS domain-containing protein [Shewanella sp. HN-41]|uniref:CBS domain-containing protein n=1 Tax=Shewanella sp. HN-41 TaxID=327275 RepID=UPI0002125EAE|nr:CBS domain-containing protein [Shewanella sp. HN-41]EGM71432.1 putative inosine-5'-monophosphate dehydrogenase protein [Shewanella sp. HN-41]